MRTVEVVVLVLVAVVTVIATGEDFEIKTSLILPKIKDRSQSAPILHLEENSDEFDSQEEDEDSKEDDGKDEEHPRSAAILEKIMNFLQSPSILPKLRSSFDDSDVFDTAEYSLERSSYEEDEDAEDEDDSLRGLILSSSAKKALRKQLEQMPCGWPDQGIPPLAPYRREEVNISANKSFIKTSNQLIRFLVAGLDDLNIKKFSVSYMNKKVKFHFIFRKIQAKSALSTDTFLNLMNEMGLSVRYEGTGNLDLSVIKLAIKGSFKYKIPLFFGSSKIYNFKAVVTLGSCESNITGLAPTARGSRLLNKQIEALIMSSINDNQDAISAMIEEAIVPPINSQLKGKNMFDLIAMMPSGPSEECIPPPDPWA